MPGHDIIVIGTSAGGLEPLTTIAACLPADLPAALFIVQHTPATGVSLLPEILDMAGALPASHVVEGAHIQRGQIYVAPPDHHVLVEREHMHVVRGPKESHLLSRTTPQLAPGSFDGTQRVPDPGADAIGRTTPAGYGTTARQSGIGPSQGRRPRGLLHAMPGLA